MKVVVRPDSGFCREEILRRCEDNGVGYVIGLAKNPRLTAAIAAELPERLFPAPALSARQLRRIVYG